VAANAVAFLVGMGVKELSAEGRIQSIPGAREDAAITNWTRGDIPQYPTEPQIYKLYWTGRLGAVGSAEAKRKRNTLLETIGEHLKYRPPGAVPSYIQSWLNVYAPNKDFKTYLRDTRYAAWRGMLNLSQPFPPSEMWIHWALQNHFGVTWEDVDKRLERDGWTVPRHRDMVVAQQLYLPSAQEDIHYYGRGLEANSALLGLSVDMPESVHDSLNRWGYNWARAVSDQETPDYRPQAWLQSRPTIDPITAQQLYWRLTDNNTERWTKIVPGVSHFTAAHLSAHYTASEYSESQRAWLQVAATPLVGHRIYSQAVQFGIVDLSNYKVHLQEEGFHPDDVTTLLQVGLAHKQQYQQPWIKSNRDRATTDLIKCLENLYEVGGIERAKVEPQLAEIVHDSTVAFRLLENIDLCRAAGIQKSAVASIRSRFLSAEIDAATAGQKLAILGIIPLRIGQYLQEWSLEFTPRHREIETGQILSLVAGGYINVAEASTRLRHLGYADPDSILLIATAEAKLSQMRAKEVAARQKADNAAKKAVATEATAKAKQLAALAKQHVAEAKQLMADARKAEPLNELKKLYRAGIIDAGLLTQRMTDYGYPMEFIEWTIQQLQTEPLTKQAKEQRAAVASGENLLSGPT
jgi:hypothetical protein